MTPAVLHVSPHPDDEILGAGGALRLLAASGWRVHNLACSLGRPADHERRRAELLCAAGEVGFATTIMNPLAKISSGDDLEQSANSIAAAVTELATQLKADIVVSPHPHDGHHGHEVVARGVDRALSAMGNAAPRWWMWGLWSDLPFPSIYVPFGDSVMNELRHGLAEYVGENARTPYNVLHPARAAAYAVLGPERVFGFGSATASEQPYADLLTEALRNDDRWLLGRPRVLDPADPLDAYADADAGVDAGVGEDISWWVTQKSAATTRREIVAKSSAA